MRKFKTNVIISIEIIVKNHSNRYSDQSLTKDFVIIVKLSFASKEIGYRLDRKKKKKIEEKTNIYEKKEKERSTFSKRDV